MSNASVLVHTYCVKSMLFVQKLYNTVAQICFNVEKYFSGKNCNQIFIIHVLSFMYFMYEQVKSGKLIRSSSNVFIIY